MDYVLPYAFTNEPRELWRQLFYKELTPLVEKTLSVSDAAKILHESIWKLYSVHYAPDQTPFSMSPLTVISHGNASCTGMSIFFAAACRSVGIPARIVGTPHWNRGVDQCPDGDESPNCGNHDWVEIWDGSWSFVDITNTAAPLVFNQSWFFPDPAKDATPGDNNHTIYASGWSRSEASTHFPMAWDWEDHSVPGFDITERYLYLDGSIDSAASSGVNASVNDTTPDTTTATTSNTATTTTTDTGLNTKSTTGTVPTQPFFKTDQEPPWWVKVMGGWDEGPGSV